MIRILGLSVHGPDFSEPVVYVGASQTSPTPWLKPEGHLKGITRCGCYISTSISILDTYIYMYTSRLYLYPCCRSTLKGT